jgi:signal transduction histidine kinase
MLHDLIATHHDAIVNKTRENASTRPLAPSTAELADGVELFLTQLTTRLRADTSAGPSSDRAIGASAALRGGDLLRLGFSVSQVVYHYGDICQAVTEIAAGGRAPISVDEFRILNRCLDTAIAEAVTEHARITAESSVTQEVERMGQLAHDIRDGLNTALIAFNIVKGGTVSITGSTGAVLGRSLLSLRDLVDSSLSGTRIAANRQRRERVSLTAFLSEITAAARLHSEYSAVGFEIRPADAGLSVDADPQVLASAVMNLLINAFKYTRLGGRVVLRAPRRGEHVHIEVEDECGGIPDSDGDPFRPFADRRGKDRTGLGLGLSIARKAVRAHGGDIHIHNMPGQGCVFTIEVPLASDTVTPKTPQVA